MAEQQAGRRGLGRGLSALLGEADPALAGPATEVAAIEGLQSRETPIELLRRNPDQPRRFFDEAELEDLAASIKEKGILQPILVRPAPNAPGEYQIVAGERRWRAAQRAGLHNVPILVREFDDLDVLEIGIIENVQRADLNPLEEAGGYKALIDKFGRTQDVVALTVGKSRSHVANMLRLLNLPEAVRAHLAEGRISTGHARAIASAADPAGLADTIVKHGLSVRQAEQLARKSADRAPHQPRSPRKSAGERNADIVAIESDMADTLGMQVAIEYSDGSGELRIRFESLEQFDFLCQRLALR